MTQESPPLWHEAKLRPATCWDYRLWHRSHRQAVFGSRRNVKRALGTDEQHLLAAAQWLATAQGISDDGGVVGRYRLDRGWTSSYPETTGYIVPTFLKLAERDPSYHARAKGCIDFLLEIQLDSGAFPAGEIASNRTLPSPFNTAQIINGLLEWHKSEHDSASLAAAQRAANWLLSEQDADGAWRNYFYNNTPATYAAHLACWLADLGAHCGNREFLSSASLNLDWVLAQRDSDTGWFDHCGFTGPEQSARIADLHTIAYTLAGILRTSIVLEREDGMTAVRRAAREIADHVQKFGAIPGMFDFAWRPRADSACLTGNAQMALIWMDLYELDQDETWLPGAWRAIDLVKRAQLMHVQDPNLHGAIPGSDPMWGWYNDGALLNWAAKFFIDALLHKAAIQATQPTP